jgi:hypothetical protein
VRIAAGSSEDRASMVVVTTMETRSSTPLRPNSLPAGLTSPGDAGVAE